MPRGARRPAAAATVAGQHLGEPVAVPRRARLVGNHAGDADLGSNSAKPWTVAARLRAAPWALIASVIGHIHNEYSRPVDWGRWFLGQ